MPKDRSSAISSFAAIACIVLIFLVLLGGAAYAINSYLTYKSNQELANLGQAIADLDASYAEGPNTVYADEDEEPVVDELPLLRPPDFTMSAPALAEQFATDRTAATEKYDFQIVRVDGRVIEVGKGDLDIPYVVLEGHDGMNVSVGFPTARTPYVEKIDQGDMVVLQGVVGAAFSDETEILLHDGGIVKYEAIIESESPQP